MNRRCLGLCLLVGALALLGCNLPGGGLVPRDAGIPPDSGLPDAGVADAGPPDAGPPDAGPPDAGPPDAGPPDAGPPDAAVPDAAVPDAGPDDAGPPDAGPPDAGPDDAGLPDAGFDAGVDSGCDGLALLDGGCGTLSFNSLCELGSLTTLGDQVAVDDAVGTRLAATLLAACVPPPNWAVVDARDGGIIVPSTGEPLVGQPETLVCGGGGYFQKHVGWLETNGYTEVRFDMPGGTTASFVRRDGGPIVNEPVVNFDGGFDYFVVELAKAGAMGPNALIAYGMGGSGTEAAGWYFENQVVPQRSTLGASWVVVRWDDTDGDGHAGLNDAFTILALGP